MKLQFYSFLFLSVSMNVLSQTPGGVNGSVLWLKANTGASASAWSDNSGTANNFSQATPANQPVLAGNVINFNAALGFDGTGSFMTQPSPTGFPTGNNDRTVFVVANATATNNYRWIFVYGSPGTQNGTFQMGNHDGELTNAFYGSPADMISAGYWNAAANASGALAAYTLTANVETQYNRGLALQTQTIGVTLLAGSVNGVIGAIDATPNELWSGSISEIIVFSSGLLDQTRNKVESYLALKYGFTLGSSASPLSYVSSDFSTVYWLASATYQNDIFGIGTDNGTALTQTQSNSMNTGSGNGTGQSAKGNLVLSAGTALANNQFLMIGNNAGVLTEQTIGAGEAPAIAVGSQRVVRNWQAQNTGTVGGVSLSYDITGLTYTGGTTASNYRLMIDDDGDGNYNTGTQTFVAPSGFTGNILNFTGVTLNNNVVFTFITQASALLPALWQGFAVTLQKNKATLTWKTSNEINVDHYTAEYSLNGVQFKIAGSLIAKNGSGINTYTLSQENLPAGTRYYRIRRVDKDGQFQFSEVKSVRAGGLNTVVLKSNPVIKSRLELIIDVQQNQDAVVRVINTNGKTLVQQYTGLSTGQNNISASLSGLAPGIYFLQVKLGDEIINRKFIKQ